MSYVCALCNTYVPGFNWLVHEGKTYHRVCFYGQFKAQLHEERNAKRVAYKEEQKAKKLAEEEKQWESDEVADRLIPYITEPSKNGGVIHRFK